MCTIELINQALTAQSFKLILMMMMWIIEKRQFSTRKLAKKITILSDFRAIFCVQGEFSIRKFAKISLVRNFKQKYFIKIFLNLGFAGRQRPVCYAQTGRYCG